MPHEIRIPRLGWSMEEGTFLGWRKQPGAQVAVGEALFELEGEKAQQDIEAVETGVLHVWEDAPRPGDLVPVGTLIGYLLKPGEAIPEKRSTAIQQRVQRSASQRTPEPTESRNRPAAHASPRARRVSAELGIDWTTLGGTGRTGRIREADVRAAAENRKAPELDARRDTSLSALRKTIAARLRTTLERTVPVTLTRTIDATELVLFRDSLRANQVVPSYTDIIACVVARTLHEHRALAARWDTDNQVLLQAEPTGINLGLAVDTPAGLLVPVVHDVLHKSLAEVAAAYRELIQRARRGQLTAADMQDGVFTITNLGAFGIDVFTPVLNYPEVAILGLGAIRREPAVLADGTIAPRDRMTLSLTFDHTALDGAPAARFVQDLAHRLENVSGSIN